MLLLHVAFLEAVVPLASGNTPLAKSADVRAAIPGLIRASKPGAGLLHYAGGGR